MSDYDRSIHENPDARAWAKLFIEMTKDKDLEYFRDESFMFAWFANAMMAMHDHLTRYETHVLNDGSAFFVGEV